MEGWQKCKLDKVKNETTHNKGGGVNSTAFVVAIVN